MRNVLEVRTVTVADRAGQASRPGPALEIPVSGAGTASPESARGEEGDRAGRWRVEWRWRGDYPTSRQDRPALLRETGTTTSLEALVTREPS
jgi:hypothetical protein